MIHSSAIAPLGGGPRVAVEARARLRVAPDLFLTNLEREQ